MTALSELGIMHGTIKNAVAQGAWQLEARPGEKLAMKSYPRLSEMGVVNPQQITRYSLSSIDYTDFLRIVYDRPKNSILPVSKTYEFPRVQDNVDAAGDAGKVLMKTSPALREALDELRDVTEAQADQRDIADALRDEVQRLEEEIAQHTEQLKVLIGRIEAS